MERKAKLLQHKRLGGDMPTLDEYLAQRWEALSSETKKTLGLESDSQARMFLVTLWTKQYYEMMIEYSREGGREEYTRGTHGS